MEVPQARTGPPGQERRGPRKTGLRTVPRFAPGRPSPHRLAISRRGGLRTSPRKTQSGPLALPLNHRPLAEPPAVMKVLAMRPASQRGRTECVPPRKPPLTLSPVLPREAIRAGLAPRGGAGFARPDMRLRLDRGMGPLGHRLIVNPSGGNGMPWFASGPYLRTRRARPSEKTASRVISGLSQLGHPSSGDQSRGWAGSARPHLTPEPVSHTRPKAQGGRLW